MSRLCLCNGIIIHNRYVTTDTHDKDNNFNYPMGISVKYLQKRHSNIRFKFTVMDSVGARSTRRLLDIGTPPNDITAFTHCEHDYIQMCKIKRMMNVNKRLVSGEVLYTEEHFTSGYHVVIDDGMQTGYNTLPRIATLLSSGQEYLVLMCNLSTRCRKRSHIKFGKNVKHIARSQNMVVIKGKKTNSYQQGGNGTVMWTFWFEFKRNE